MEPGEESPRKPNSRNIPAAKLNQSGGAPLASFDDISVASFDISSPDKAAGKKAWIIIGWSGAASATTTIICIGPYTYKVSI
jgi:hypothetical protein